MKERGILFTPENYRKVSNGTKIQTRRLQGLKKINKHPDTYSDPLEHAGCAIWQWDDGPDSRIMITCPYGIVGDRLYVKEGLSKGPHSTVCWRSDGLAVYPFQTWTWNRDTLSPMHMPKWAARLWIEITDVKAERIQHISLSDIGDEGYAISVDGGSPSDFALSWDRINGAGAWHRNDWVWCLLFKKVQP